MRRCWKHKIQLECLTLLALFFIAIWIYITDTPFTQTASVNEFTLLETVNRIQNLEESFPSYIEAARFFDLDKERLKKFKDNLKKQENRTQILKDQCTKRFEEQSSERSFSKTAWRYGPMMLNYCEVPKVGCTFWKRVLRFLAGEYSKYANVSKPSDIDRHHVHYMRIRGPNLTTYTVNSTNIQQIKKRNEKAFLFTREPYGRLWSAFVDKYILPDFWSSPVTEHLLHNMRGTPFRTNKTELLCGDDISFSEFLEFITSGNKFADNPHWIPIDMLCKPCEMPYEVVGRFEDFKNDSEFVLQLYGLSHLIENTTHSDHADSEITTLSMYNFNLALRRRKKYNDSACYDGHTVAKRLWLAFQMSGYLDRLENFPASVFENNSGLVDPGTFINKVRDVRNKQTISSQKLKEQKVRMLIDAYKAVPKETLEKVGEYFKNDFLLFGYDRRPKNIFS